MGKLILLILAIILLSFGCITTKCPPCPSGDILEWAHTPFGSFVVRTNKDFYSEKNHSIESFKRGHGWLTIQEYNQLQQEEEKTQMRLKKSI